MTRLTACGHHAASVSIRSGRGSATHDRVLRFVPIFDTADAASHYAQTHGIAWVADRALRSTHSSTNQD